MVPTFVNAILQDLPLPARLVPWPKALPTTLTKCVALALLLHVWLVVLLGNAPGGTAPQGQGVWGAINVTLRGPMRDGPPSGLLPPVPAQENTLHGNAPMPRWGGAVRPADPPPAAKPGAARLGEAAPVLAVPAPAAPAAPTTLSAAPAAPAPTAPTALTAPTAPAAPTALPAPPGRVVQERAAPVSIAPVTEAVRELVAESEPAPAPVPASTPAPAETLTAAPRPDRQLASPLMQAPASATAAPLPRLAAPPALPPLAALPAVADAPAALRQLQATPTAAAPALQPPLPRSSDLPPLPTLAPSAMPGASLATTRPAAPSLPSANSANSAASANSANSAHSAHSAAAPDAGAQVGHDVATPPAAAASAPPRLNLQLSRPRGGELSRSGSTGVLPLLPRPPERDDKLAREIEKAGKADCRSAYAGLGPLAVIPLALDAVRKDGGCKW